MIDFTRIEEYRENNRIEAKKALGGLPHSIWETYSAFANTLGGVLLLGVEEHADHSLHPVDLPDPERLVREFWTMVNDPKIVSANILTDHQVQILTADGCRIIAITVPRALRRDRPVYIGGSALSGSYRRSGEGDYKCTREEVLSMQRDAAVETMDMAVLPQIALDTLDGESIRRYRLHLQGHRRGWDHLTGEAFLEQLGAAGRDGGGILHPTTAGLLLFGCSTAIVEQFPNYLLEYREHLADDGGCTMRLSSADGTWSGNLYDFYCQVRRRFQEAFGDETVQEALVEALVNSLLNADYHGRPGVVIVRHKNRLTFSNPGTFRIAVETARSGGISDPRNAALTRMFHLAHIGRRSGSGIPRICAVWRDQGWTPPRIEERFSPERTILTLTMDALPAQRGGGHPAALGPVQKQMIIEYLTEHIRAGADEIAAYVRLDPARTEALLQALVADGIVITDGPRPVYQLKA